MEEDLALSNTALDLVAGGYRWAFAAGAGLRAGISALLWGGREAWPQRSHERSDVHSVREPEPRTH